MPHDAKGRKVNVGDTVTIQAVVEHIYEGESACNFAVKIEPPACAPVDALNEYRPQMTFNSRLVLLDDEANLQRVADEGAVKEKELVLA